MMSSSSLTPYHKQQRSKGGKKQEEGTFVLWYILGCKDSGKKHEKAREKLLKQVNCQLNCNEDYFVLGRFLQMSDRTYS